MTFFSGRHAGVLVPLFSIPSRRSWGIGEIGDLPLMARWAASGGLDLLQLLPVNEMAGGQNSPYSANSAMALDPIFISVADVEDFQRLGGEGATTAEFQQRLGAARHAEHIDYQAVRALKAEALRAAFDRFHQAEWTARSSRAAALQRFIDEESWWLADYSLFRAIHEHQPAKPWTRWKRALRERQPAALAAARATFDREILFRQYLQWIAASQWQAARAAMAPVGLFGDFPFMVSQDSADVWARQGEFLRDASVGVPPDAFSETGQDWGLPVYRWDVIARTDYGWLRQRARRSAELFDGYRVDHLVGFYRTYVRPHDGRPPFFTPGVEQEQLALGEHLLEIFGSAGPRIIAEDLGVVPAFVRESLTRLGVPGYKVMRWERDWDLPLKPFRDPAIYPPVSVATSGTHDTEPLKSWWRNALEDERQQLLRLPNFEQLTIDAASPDYPPALRDALLASLFASRSDFLLLPIQDIFGWDDRVNVPATVTDENWTYRLPWAIDEMESQPDARERADALRRWSEASGRSARQSE